jgi:hypothetical protein
MKEGFCEVFKGACAYGKRVIRNVIRRIVGVIPYNLKGT